MKKITQIFTILSVVTILFACNGYNKILKSGTLDEKYEAAKKLYDNESYYKAYTLFDELLSVHKGTAKAPDVYYYYTYFSITIKIMFWPVIILQTLQKTLVQIQEQRNFNI